MPWKASITSGASYCARISMNEVVSVVVPCLNRSHFLRPTIESILKQDYPHIECIVVDGGSTDDTMKILKEYGERIRWISEPAHHSAFVVPRED